MAVKDINSLSPKYRDILLNQNIGKYAAITTPLIDPIGKSIDIFNSTPFLKKSITNGDLLNYTNNNIKNNYYNQYRNLDSNILEYIDSKNKYSKDYSYIDETSKGLIEQTTNGILSYLLGGEVNVGVNSGNNIQINSSFDYGNTLPGLALNVSLGIESELGKIGLRSLGLQLANSVLDKTRRSEAVLRFLEKPLDYYDAIDKLDTEKLNLSPGLSNFIGSTFPIYLYSEIRSDASTRIFANPLNNVNADFSWKNNSGNLINNDSEEVSLEDIMIKESLIYKTQQMFKSGKIQTIISDLDNSRLDSRKDGLISKGRGLKGIGGEYSRSWLVNKQYRNVKDLIRPFTSNTFDGKDNIAILKKDLERVRPGVKSLETFGVLQNDGFVKISPYSNFDSKTDVHKYMFSIENLAWKQKDGFLDSLIQKSSQDGPNGGRIMWFPPYDIKFTDNTNVNWNSDNFIGRGEPVYTYVNTERAGSLSFKVIVDHPSIINYYKQKDPSGQIIKDDDYLRLFAGMDVIELEEIEKEPPTQDIPKQTPITKQTEVYKFKIYFPNNLSGIDYSDPKDVMRYLSDGNNCEWLGGNGYEIAKGAWGGLNKETDVPCQNNKFYYKVDSAYENQNLHYPLSSQTPGTLPNNYKDTISYGLNSMKSESEDFSFLEIATAFFNVDSNNGSADQKLLGILKTITKIEINGCASNQGDDKLNTQLSDNRAKVVENWLKNYINLYDPNIKTQNITSKGVYKTSVSTSNDTNILSMKKDRFVVVQLTANPKIEFNAPKDTIYANTEPIIQPINSSSTATRTKVDMYGYTVKDNNAKLENDEAKFFEEIGKDKDFIFEQFSEKIKYFHPAFHSTTPEGFNSRLTFLHQCTRQGNTENSAGLATNLAFGRPPICILRIGDFYNTKIIIDNLNIDFEPLVWDMNPEGIGVQPMLANINMSFKFIGGSDLTGPIARLQNAITFNFFANTGVYDNRNDRITSIGLKQSSEQTKGFYTEQYSPMYNPGVYDDQQIPVKNN